MSVEEDPFYSLGDRIKKTPSRREETGQTFTDARQAGDKQGVFVVAGDNNSVMKFKPNTRSHQARATINGNARNVASSRCSQNPYEVQGRDQRLQAIIAQRASNMK